MEINHRVIVRHDPKATQILDSATFVTLYQFDEASQEWVIRISTDIFL